MTLAFKFSNAFSGVASRTKGRGIMDAALAAGLAVYNHLDAPEYEATHEKAGLVISPGGTNEIWIRSVGSPTVEHLTKFVERAAPMIREGNAMFPAESWNLDILNGEVSRGNGWVTPHHRVRGEVWRSPVENVPWSPGDRGPISQEQLLARRAAARRPAFLVQ